MGIKIQDIAYMRFGAPDLEMMEAFLGEFGMIRTERTDDTLYMRGLDEDPFLHVTHRGAPASMKDREALAQEENALLA
jgi:hypothetical protein